MTKENVIRYFWDLPELQTERLLLRRMKKLDYRDMYDYACREDVTQYLTWYPHPNSMYTLRYLTYIVTRYRAGEFFDWAVICKENRKMIGTCGFTTFHYGTTYTYAQSAKAPDAHSLYTFLEQLEPTSRYDYYQ